MANSMTAFARSELSTDQGNLAWELRSVNHRYLEVTLRLPETQEVVLHFQDRLGKPVDARAVVADEEGVLLEPRTMPDLKNLVPADAPREFLVDEGKLVAHLPVGQYRLYCHAPDNPLGDVHVFDFDVGNGAPEWSFTVE